MRYEPTIQLLTTKCDQYRTVRINGKRVQELVPKNTYTLALVDGHPQSVRKVRKT